MPKAPPSPPHNTQLREERESGPDLGAVSIRGKTCTNSSDCRTKVRYQEWIVWCELLYPNLRWPGSGRPCAVWDAPVGQGS
eukprot:4441015-Prymnesium_polylepis.1